MSTLRKLRKHFVLVFCSYVNFSSRSKVSILRLCVVGSLPLPDIVSMVTIVGICGEDPCVIDGGGMGQIFIVGVGGKLTLKNLEIHGGSCSEGGAVLVNGNIQGGGGRLLALNVFFHNNMVSGSGGAIMVKAGALAHIRSCVFEGNRVCLHNAILISNGLSI